MRETEKYRSEAVKESGATKAIRGRELESKAAGSSRRREQKNEAIRNIRRRERESCGELYRELTGEGKRFCALAGLLEELVVLAALGIEIRMSPVPVLAFLWVLFAILTAAALIGADCLRGHIAAFRIALERVEERRNVAALRTQRVRAEEQYGREPKGRIGYCSHSIQTPCCLDA